MVESIVVKGLVGMLGVLFFLRISGKTQMAQLTPLDSVNAFVLGALVGGVVYNPDLSAWYMVLALGVWTVFNLLIRFLLRFKHLRRLIKGDTVMIVQGGKINLKEFRVEWTPSQGFYIQPKNEPDAATGAVSDPVETVCN